MALNRRNFLKASLTSVAAASTAVSTWAQPIGANNVIRVGVVGIRSKGAQHIEVIRKIPGVRVVALCDVDSEVLAREVKKFTDRQEKVAGYTDIRKMLEDKSIDAVSIATPNHWHSLIAIWACQAGKDVYVEKPVSHNVWEGRQLVKAARKYNRIVQAGTQNRSDTGLREVFPLIHQGELGKIQYVRGLCYRQRSGIGKVNGPQDIPSSIDYNLWTGPAPLEPLRRKRLHYDWHWMWNTGNGDIGNQGPHEMDLARWALQEQGLPQKVISFGGRYAWDDDGETANVQYCVMDYPTAPVIFEVINLRVASDKNWMPNIRGIGVGVIIQGEHGYFAGGRGGGWTYDNDGKRMKRFSGDGGGSHHANFFEAVRARKSSILRAEIEEGHLSSSMCHLCNISYQLGTHSSLDTVREALGNRLTCQADLDRIVGQLKANHVDLDQQPLTLGPTVEIDTKTEQIVNHGGPYSLERWMNDMAHGSYRAPFEVPEQV